MHIIFIDIDKNIIFAYMLCHHLKKQVLFGFSITVWPSSSNYLRYCSICIIYSLDTFTPHTHWHYSNFWHNTSFKSHAQSEVIWCQKGTPINQQYEVCISTPLPPKHRCTSVESRKPVFGEKPQSNDTGRKAEITGAWFATDVTLE